MKFLDNNIADYTGTNFNVYKDGQGVTVMKFNSNDIWVSNVDIYSKLFLGKCDSCTSFYRDTFDGFTYDSVLVAGLGLGLIPQDLYEVENCSTVDVVEIDQEVIDFTNTSGHLNSNINLIQGDIHTYTTAATYDLIIVDTIWSNEEMTEEQWNNLVTNYTDNLNTGGAIYLPVSKKWVTV